MKKTVPYLLSAMLAASAAAPAQHKPGGGPPGPPPPPEVTCVVVEPRTIEVPNEFTAIAQPSRVSEVRARIKGYIAERLFTEGAKVKAGDVLYRIEKESFEADVEMAAARVESAEASLRLMAQESERMKRLVETSAGSPSDLDKAKTSEDESKAAVRLAKADLSKSKLELGYTDVRAPIGGIVGKAQRDIGAFVDSSENGLLTTITTIDPIYISFGVSERSYSRFASDRASGKIVTPKGMAFDAVLQDGSAIKGGKLNYEDTAFNEETGSMQFRVEFANPGDRLKPGQILRARVLGLERPDTVAIPQRCVSQSPGGASVLVVGPEEKVESRTVTLGSWLGDAWVIEAGLKRGDRVVVEGAMHAYPGTQVKVVAGALEGVKK